MNDLVKEALYELCRKVDSPKSLGIWLRYKYAHKELSEASIDPLAYNDAATFFKDYTCVNLLRKFEGLNTGIDTRKVALLDFDKSEEQCQAVNERFRTYATTGQVDQVESAILLKTQQIIAKVWGHPSFSEAFRRCGWGPGATATLTSVEATTESKMSEFPMSVTPSALPYLRQVMKYDLLWCGHLLKCPVEGPVCLTPQYYRQIAHSRLLTVLKDAKTDRTIAAEPTGNIFLQKGIGGYLRSRLRRYGINLDDQTRNQVLASKAALLNLATLDLSAASDTISIGLCKVLLPPDMFALLDSLRSPAYSLDNSIRRFHKFSSMGNGFTFELETLIFYAAAKAVQETEACLGPIGVYGDDIIVPQRIVGKVISVLESFGFTINKRKSFVDGRFFESCGKHFFDNVDVTPIYQKRIVDNDLETSRFFNRVYDLAYKRPFLGSEVVFGKVHSRLYSRLPERLKKFSAPGWTEGDGFFRVLHFHGRFCPNRGYHITYMAALKSRSKVADGGLYAYMIRKGHDPIDSINFMDSFITYEGEVKFIPQLISVGLLTKKLIDFATEGTVTFRPRGRIVAFKRSKRWVSILRKETPVAQKAWCLNE